MFFLAIDSLADPNLIAGNTAAAGMIGGGLVALILGAIAVFLVIFALLWIYMSFAFTAIGKKAGLSSPGLAWIPGIGPVITAFRASKMHWWPWLLLLGILISWIPLVNIIYILAMIVFGVYSIIWNWKMFEAIGKPGWWAILYLIPIVNLVIIGIAAWSK
jgi:hypothetical protein